MGKVLLQNCFECPSECFHSVRDLKYSGVSLGICDLSSEISTAIF